MKTIIIPTDYSDNAFNAAKHGFFLAYQLKAQVLLLHVCHVPATQGPKTGETAAQSDPVAPHIEQLEKIGGQLKQSYPVHLEYAVRFGVLLEELTRLVESQHADVVVMGRRGANLLEEKVFGSASMSVLYQAAFPVLIVPGETPVKPIRRILFACDIVARQFTESAEGDCLSSTGGGTGIAHCSTTRRANGRLAGDRRGTPGKDIERC
jgi:nucleotide-binding universal stress UspA family protein